MENLSEHKKAARPARLFVLSEFVDATENSTGYYWAKIIAGLAKQFESIYVICPEASYRNLNAPLPGINYLRFKDFTFDKNRIFGRILGQFFRALRFAWMLMINARRGDVVFSGTNPAMFILFIATLKRLIGFRWLLLVHDVFPENLIPAGIVGEHGLIYRLASAVFRNAYATADVLIAIGRDMDKTLLAKTKNRARVVYIPNWVDPNDIAPAVRESVDLLQTPAWAGLMVFQFFGNFGRVQGLEDLLAALPLVRAKNAGFVFIGGGALQILVDDFVERHPDINIICMPPLPFAENAKGLAACDVAIVSLSKGMKGLAVPSKAYFSLAADRPLLVVCDEDSELHMLIREGAGLGWFCESGNPEALAKLIDDICHSNLSDFYGHPRYAARVQYCYDQAIARYAECIRELGLRSISDAKLGMVPK